MVVKSVRNVLKHFFFSSQNSQLLTFRVAEQFMSLMGSIFSSLFLQSATNQ